MIRHSVMFKVKPGMDREQILSIMNSIPLNVDKIRYWQVRYNNEDHGEGGDYWDMQLVADFETWDDLHAYEADAYHKRMVDLLIPMFSHRAICDFAFDESNVGGKFGALKYG
jgi:hypothetical protein